MTSNRGISSGRAAGLGVLFAFAMTALIALLGRYFPAASIEFAEDTGYLHYYWKLPDPTFWTRLSAWGCYLAHQLLIWICIAYAQQKRPRYTSGLHRFNVIALCGNALFGFLHLAQTRIFYDGLAQDVPIWTAQFSVIFMLGFVLIFENRRRGMFFGKRMPWSQMFGDFLRRYHGYYFSWAIIYTYWYHPMETDPRHYSGFVYTFLLLVQSSLFFTRMHTNRWWTVSMEASVLFHGALVAWISGQEMWHYFLFGFVVLFIFTQMHGLGLSIRKRWVLGLTLTLITIVFYVVRQDLVGFLRNFRLPLSYYLGGLILSLLFAAGVRSFRWTRGLFEREAPRGGVMPRPGESQRPTPP